MISGKNVLVTGGAGSVGRALVNRFLDLNADTVRILDSSEPQLADLKSELDDGRCRYLVGDVRDKERMARAIEDIDYVVHTAAMKHVDICEYNPFEAVKTNIVGLQNLIDVALDSTVQRFIFTSSDKAVNPANTMGTTKLLGEKLVTAANKHKGKSEIRFSSVRFGNVVNSSQSVVPLFKKQILEGGPVTLTDSKMTRFFLTYDDLTNLVIDAMNHTVSGEIFINKMDAIVIEDLAEAMIDTLAPEYGYQPSDIDVKIIGRRPGETYHEEIMTAREAERTLENDHLYAIIPEAGSNGYLDHQGIEGFQTAGGITRVSSNAQKLNKEEITTFLDRGGLSAKRSIN